MQNFATSLCTKTGCEINTKFTKLLLHHLILNSTDTIRNRRAFNTQNATIPIHDFTSYIANKSETHNEFHYVSMSKNREGDF